VFIVIFIILGLRWTGILDRRTLVRLDITSLAAEASQAGLAVERDSGAHADGVELEYNSQICTVSLARAAAIDGPPAAAAEGAKLRGGVTAEQVWTPYVVPVAGAHDSIDAAELWRKRASSAVSRLVTAIKDANVFSSDAALAMTGSDTDGSTKQADRALVLVGSCGLGALEEAAVRFFPGASRVVCSEQSAADTEIAMEHMQRRASGEALLASSVVLAPGPSLVPRLGSALSGKVSLVLSPIESTFLKVSMVPGLCFEPVYSSPSLLSASCLCCSCSSLCSGLLCDRLLPCLCSLLLALRTARTRRAYCSPREAAGPSSSPWRR
jgi:hypothetical protein